MLLRVEENQQLELKAGGSIQQQGPSTGTCTRMQAPCVKSLGVALQPVPGNAHMAEKWTNQSAMLAGPNFATISRATSGLVTCALKARCLNGALSIAMSQRDTSTEPNIVHRWHG